MMSINEIKFQISTLRPQVKKAETQLFKSKKALSDAYAYRNTIRARIQVPGYNECKMVEKEKSRCADCMTVEEQIQALRDGFKLESVFGEVMFVKNVTELETPEEYAERISHDNGLLGIAENRVGGLKKSVETATKTANELNQRMDQYLEEQRQYYRDNFGKK